MSQSDKGRDVNDDNMTGLRARLQHAALELFRERGYDGTTAAQIAARVGVTGRTFFRQFPDKKEVLFDGEAVLRAALVSSIATAPPALGALETLFQAFRSTIPLLEGNRSFSVPRQAIISGTPALVEREAAKHAALADALADALEARAIPPRRAELAARIGMAAYVRATLDWLAEPVPPLAKQFEQTFHEVRLLLDGQG